MAPTGTTQGDFQANATGRYEPFLQAIDTRLEEKLGARYQRVGTAQGTVFSVWAPRAKQVCVVGDFNHWTPNKDPLFLIPDGQIWSTFVPSASPGARYQYLITDTNGTTHRKSDPMATASAPLPDHASVIPSPEPFSWNDDFWMLRRDLTAWAHEPISIYELHLGSWRKPYPQKKNTPTYRNIAQALVDYIKSLGFTHVLFMPLLEHPFDGSWGYQVTGYFAPTSRYGNPEDLAYLVDTLHRNGIGVLFDWVPAHFPKDDFGLAQFDGQPLYENPCPQQGNHPDWGTAIFDYGNPQVQSFLISSALSWFRRFHFDGIRVDAVASMLYRDYSRPSGDWTPNVEGGRENLEAVQFLQLLNHQISEEFPSALKLAEESTAWPGVTRSIAEGGLGFDLKWNLGWMHDTLAFASKPPSERSNAYHELLLPAQYQGSENYCLPFSHDEVVHEKGSMLGKIPSTDRSTQIRTLRALYTWQWAWPGKKLLFMGSEFGQPGEWDHQSELDWPCSLQESHQGITDLITELNRLYRAHPRWGQSDGKQTRFEWLVANDPWRSVAAFVRYTFLDEPALICITNFSDAVHERYLVPLPFKSEWVITLSSDATATSKSTSECQATTLEDGNLALRLSLPALTTIILTPIAEKDL